MKHLKKFNENIIYIPSDEIKSGGPPTEGTTKKEGYLENAYVVNGAWFPFGIPKKLIIGSPKGEISEIMKRIIDDANDKFKDDLAFPICYAWIYNSWMKYRVPVTPSYWFQAPLYEKEKAIELSEYLTQKFDETFAKISVIAIAGGWVWIRKDDKYNCFGEAYVKSGRFIDNPHVMSKYGWNNNRIFFVE